MNNNLKLLTKYKIGVTLLGILLVSTFIAGSLFVYDYTEHEPKFCTNCHLMQPAFKAWKSSIHKQVECHDCHYATVLERNKMLLKTLFEKPTQVSERPHDKIIVPSTKCIRCHWEGNKPIPKISESTGHAMHWFKGGIECTSCHAITLHEFKAEQRLCVNCHEAGRVVLAKMKNMFCTECHNFRKGRLVPDSNACAKCHATREPPPPGKRTLAHQQFECNTCHHTHDLKRSAKTSCPNCHFLTMKRGKHPLHIENLGEDCLACHKPHRWHISKDEARTLCSECHDPYPLSKFN